MLRSLILLLVLIVTSCTFDAQAETDGDEARTTERFVEHFNGDTIDTSRWQVANWQEHGGQTAPERAHVEDGYLHLILVNDPDGGYLTSAIQTHDEFLFGRWEARLKPSSVPGVLNSFYTIDWNNTSNSDSDSDGTKQEIDIEFLSNSFGPDYGEIHLALHEPGRQSFETNPDIALGFNPSDNFHVYGFEITPAYVEWFVDDLVLKRYTFGDTSSAITVDAAYQLKLNTWTREEWIGGPPELGVESIYMVDWIRFTPLDDL